MFQMDSIYPVSDFSRKPKAHIKRLKETGLPEILTINGKAELVIQDAHAYEEMIELLNSLKHIEAASIEHEKGAAIDSKLAFKNIREKLQK